MYRQANSYPLMVDRYAYELPQNVIRLAHMKNRMRKYLFILLSCVLQTIGCAQAEGIFELLDPCVAAKEEFQSSRSEILDEIREQLEENTTGEPSIEFTNYWWAEKRRFLLDYFSRSELAELVKAAGGSDTEAFALWMAKQIEREGGADRLDNVVVVDEFHRLRQLVILEQRGSTEKELERAKRELYGECALELLDQRIGAQLTVTSLDIIAGNFEAAASERGDLSKLVRATTGISVSDIQRYGMLGGRNSEFRRLFSSLLDGEHEEYVTVPVWYVTDRKPVTSKNGQQTYGGERGSSVSYGATAVTIPTDHRMGELEAPKWWRFEFTKDPRKHVLITSLKAIPRQEFFTSLRAQTADLHQRQVFVFVHGYNVSFEDAARRTGQIAYDLNFQGAPILYSWPSEDSLSSYLTDANNSEWTIPHLERFLLSLSQSLETSTIHLIAHSMGNKPLVRALGRIAQASDVAHQYNQVILTAPDIDADVFSQLALRITSIAERVTLYASNNDNALNVSKNLGGDYPRAGEAGDRLVIVPGIDTIDVTGVASGFLGHSYYGDNRSILTDIFQLFKSGMDPGARFGLQRSTSNGRSYWIFKP